jgi:hypothetical protein
MSVTHSFFLLGSPMSMKRSSTSNPDSSEKKGAKRPKRSEVGPPKPLKTCILCGQKNCDPDDVHEDPLSCAHCSMCKLCVLSSFLDLFLSLPCFGVQTVKVCVTLQIQRIKWALGMLPCAMLISHRLSSVGLAWFLLLLQDHANSGL